MNVVGDGFYMLIKIVGLTFFWRIKKMKIKDFKDCGFFIISVLVSELCELWKYFSLFLKDFIGNVFVWLVFVSLF